MHLGSSLVEFLMCLDILMFLAIQVYPASLKIPVYLESLAILESLVEKKNYNVIIFPLRYHGATL